MFVRMAVLTPRSLALSGAWKISIAFLITPFLCLQAISESNSRCLEAASLWLPREDAPLKRVSKWNAKAIGYEITPDNAGAAVVNAVEDALQFQSQYSGTKISHADGFDVDLLIGVVPNVSALSASAARESVTNYFQDFYRRSGTQGTFHIDDRAWDTLFRSVVPPCGGVTLTNRHAKERSFLAVQLDAAPPCIIVGLGEIFGLGNIRYYYLKHADDVPSDLIKSGLQTLYDARISAGMSRADALYELKGVCDGR